MFICFRPFKYWLFSILIGLFFSTTTKANPIAKCDSLIVAGVEALNKNEHIKSLEYLTQARTIAEKNRWHKQSFLAINNIGANYYRIFSLVFP